MRRLEREARAAADAGSAFFLKPSTDNDLRILAAGMGRWSPDGAHRDPTPVVEGVASATSRKVAASARMLQEDILPHLLVPPPQGLELGLLPGQPDLGSQARAPGAV